MNTRFYNGKILTMKNNMEILEEEIWIVGSKIEYIGPSKESDITWDREIDLQGNLVMPGFKNAHTHSAMTFLRSAADDYPLQEWLNEQIFPREARLESEDVYWLSRLAILEYLSSGITSNFDMYFNPEEIARASVDSGFRTVIVGALNDFSQSLEEIEKYYLGFNNNEKKYNGLISYKIGFHAEYTTDEKLLKGIAELSKKYKAPVWTHNSETKREVDEIGRASCRERV